jgi:hypothetical protein
MPFLSIYRTDATGVDFTLKRIIAVYIKKIYANFKLTTNFCN